MTPEELREMGLYRTAEFGQTVHTRVSRSGSCWAFSGSPIQAIDDANEMRDELLTRLATETKRADDAEAALDTTARSLGEAVRQFTTVEAERDLLRDGLLSVAEHHERLNNRVLRPLDQSTTLRIVRDALSAGAAQKEAPDGQH
jgi:hypothetical protein